MAEGRLAAHRGADAGAFEAFLAVGRLHGELLIVNPAVLPWRSEAALAARRLGQRDRAGALVAEERRLAERFGAPRAIGVARRAAGLLARGDDAIDLLRSAAGVLGDCGARVEHARALADLGAAVRRRGHPAQARPILRDALALAEDVGALAVAEAARTELRVAGGRAPRRATAPVDRLTPGERRVAELAADGTQQPADRQRPVHHRQGRGVAPRQRLPQARCPRQVRPALGPGDPWGAALVATRPAAATLDLSRRTAGGTDPGRGRDDSRGKSRC